MGNLREKLKEILSEQYSWRGLFNSKGETAITKIEALFESETADLRTQVATLEKDIVQFSEHLDAEHSHNEELLKEIAVLEKKIQELEDRLRVYRKDVMERLKNQ